MAAPAASFTVIPIGDVDPDSPVTTGLMDSLRLNDQNVFAQIVGDPVSAPTFTPAAEHDHDGVNSKILSGPSSALQLIELKELAAPATSVTFSGLVAEGDDATMVLIGRVRGATGNLHTLTLQPNGITAGQSCTLRRLRATMPVTTFSATVNRLLLYDDTGSAGATDTNYFRAEIFMRRVVQGVSSRRMITCNAMVPSGSTSPDLQVSSGLWADIVTDVTSLDVVSSAANEMAAGSSFALYRLRIN